MKSFIVAACIVACAYAVSTDESAQVLRSTYDQNPAGDFQYAFETDNGIRADASGSLKSFGKDEVAVVITGSNSYKSADGKDYSLSYVADETGYHPSADFLPTPPAPEPIPEYIQRAIEYIAAHPYTEKKN